MPGEEGNRSRRVVSLLFASADVGDEIVGGIGDEVVSEIGDAIGAKRTMAEAGARGDLPPTT